MLNKVNFVLIKVVFKQMFNFKEKDIVMLLVFIILDGFSS